MLKKLLFTGLSVILLSNSIGAQTQENFKAINELWAKFSQAFDSLDYTLMADIHSKELVRISAGERISDYYTYIAGYKKGFERKKAENETNNISLRFFERIHNDSVASERGIYQLIRNKDRPAEQAYYGQFHVVFKKEAGTWKIIMDYDSNPDNSIGEEQ